MAIETTIGGQSVIINELNNVLKFNIDTPFFTAWRKLGWSFQSSGLGVNRTIIRHVLTNKMRLFIHVNDDDKDYIIEPEILEDFILKNETKYVIKNTWLNVIPKSIFKEL
jgi:hypothetical protein